MLKVGTILLDRYEIIEHVGTGGMADVYRAKDHKLKREVAVKVLKQEFNSNAEFVVKFRNEAESAAGLMHPNIVNVYDVGEENGIYFIVMEFVNGITLKDYIQKKSRLSVKETVAIAVQISKGIEAAHNNNIIHRDIKPQNVIISRDGATKVTDFGIAKVPTSNTVTANVMGSVHYTSPEQARGGYSDRRSDIYSLGITMFEMLTGKVPFNGETTVAIALKHIQEPMPSPRDFVPEIPISLEQIVLKCTQKSPDRRYQVMADLIEDLKKSLISPDENFVKMEAVETMSATKEASRDEQLVIKQGRTDVTNKEVRETIKRIEETEKKKEAPSDIDATRPASKEEIEAIRRSQAKSTIREVERVKEAQRTGDPERRPKSAQGRPERSERAERSERPDIPVKKSGNGKPSGKPSKSNQGKGKTKKPQKPVNRLEDEEESGIEKVKNILIILTAVAIGLIVLYLAGIVLGVWDNTGNSVKTENVEVPNVTGQTLENAKDAMIDAGLQITIKEESSDITEVNHIISTNPAAGTVVETGSAVELKVSVQGSDVIVPDVMGYTEAQATSVLEDEGFTVVKLREFSDDVEKDLVMTQTPAGLSSLKRGETVTLTISLGEESVSLQMPDLTGKSETDAKDILNALGLQCRSVTEDYSETVEAGKVCSQSYTANSSIKKGTQIDIVLSKGPEPRYYNCNTSVLAPPNYQQGTQARVTLTAADGTTVLFDTTTTNFPCQINLSSIYGVPKGIVTITYTYYTTETVYDAEGNPQVQSTPIEDKVTYEVEFDS